MATMSPVTLKAVEMLSWEWQSREAVLERLIKTVPSGRALRKYEALAASAEKSRESATRVKPPLPESEKIYSGARALAQASLKTLVDSGRAEFSDDEDGTPNALIRFRDRRSDAPTEGACPTCHRPFVPARRMRRVQPMAKVLYPSQGVSWKEAIDRKRAAQ